ncbi:uncharacterized protein [Blastocystis hominis]|uniref:Uncharacterized protein n=1 Tax=Blastocystis hominis TaxID=12968 RepID=D8M502_BLAHO|nr:uncharacterized protein [Blastocystis hominis]CBK23141.2 unnamed protein product [Blastocystis hominis]|eukprot:XP_012897189.1 uncharacterized protein [Blastocystis hominis]
MLPVQQHAFTRSWRARKQPSSKFHRVDLDGLSVFP